MNEYNELLKRFTAIEDELIRLRKQRNYELNNLDEDNIPKLRQYSQIISENQAAVSLVEQKVSDVESSVTLLSQYTSMDNVVVVESSDDKSAWDTTRVYYDKTAKVYYYYNGEQWLTTASPVTAGLDTSIAQIQAKADKNESEISLVAKSVTSLGSEVSGQINDLTQNIASVKTTADSASASVSAIVESVGSDGKVTAASIVAKINAAGSAVQISADHISLKGKTIALTSDSINITSTYFNVTTAGAVACTSLAVTGDSSIIYIATNNAANGIIRSTYSVETRTFSEVRPNGFYSSNYITNGGGLYSGAVMQIAGLNNDGTLSAVTESMSSITLHNGLTNTDTFMASNAGYNGYVANTVIVNGTLGVIGSKPKIEPTEHYGHRLMYAFESPNPLYSDFGRATIADDGLCYVFIEPIFYECIDNTYDYFVFIQPENGGEFAVIDRTSDHFTVRGTPGKSFAWMLVTAQKGYSATRTEEIVIPEPEPAQTPDPENAVYDAVGDEILKEFENQLG